MKKKKCGKCKKTKPVTSFYRWGKGWQKWCKACKAEYDREYIEIAVAYRQGWSLERLKKELSKCDMLCSNCHRKLHWGNIGV